MKLTQPCIFQTVFMYLPAHKSGHEFRFLFLAHNITNVIGYFPLIGMIAGIVRLIFASHVYSRDTDENIRKFWKFEMLRGLCEQLPFAGVALIIIDIVHTIKFL